MKRWIHIILFLFIIVSIDCKNRQDTYTSGRRFMFIADPYLPLMKQASEGFMNLYPEVKMELKSTSTREAIVNLLNDSVHSVVIDRKLNDEERQVAQQASIKIIEDKIAEDGIAIIVHKVNPIKNISPTSAQRIISRVAQDWHEIPESRWSGTLDFVISSRNSGMYELLQKKLLPPEKSLVPSAVVENQLDVIQYVSMHTRSIGFVASSLTINRPANVKIVPVLIKSPKGRENEYFPGQQEIYESLYPFHYSLYLCNAEAKATVGIGFSAFMLSNEGQKIIQKAGLVPVSVPYRTIQITAE